MTQHWRESCLGPFITHYFVNYLQEKSVQGSVQGWKFERLEAQVYSKVDEKLKLSLNTALPTFQMKELIKNRLM